MSATTPRRGSELLQARIAVDNLYRPFALKVEALLDEASAGGNEFWVISGFRDLRLQEALYAIGRTVDVHRETVTDARGGESAHNYGIAVDVCKDADMRRSGLQPNWELESYAPLKALCAKHGLVWGGNWKSTRRPHGDSPHIQWPGFVTATQLEPLREAFEAGGLDAVFEKIDEIQGGAPNGSGH